MFPELATPFDPSEFPPDLPRGFPSAPNDAAPAGWPPEAQGSAPPTATGPKAGAAWTEKAASRPPSNAAEVGERAQLGDDSVLPYLKEILDQNPHVWQEFGDLAGHVQDGWLKAIHGTNYLAIACAKRFNGHLVVELAGPSPTPLEKLLAERIVACKLACHHAERQIVDRGGEEMTPAVKKLLFQRLESANRSLNGAVKALAQVRKMATGIKIEIHHAPPQPAEAVKAPAAVPQAAPATSETAAVPETSTPPAAERIREFVAVAAKEEAVVA